MNINITLQEHFALIEAAWHRPTATYNGIMKRSIDEWYHLITPKEQDLLLSWVRRDLKEDRDQHPVCGGEVILMQQLWLGRYDSMAQYIASKGDERKACFRVGDRYWTSSFSRVPDDDPDIVFDPICQTPKTN